MRALKTTLFLTAMAFSQISAAADDGTFTINIQGPDNSESQSSQTDQALPERIQEAPLPSNVNQNRRASARAAARRAAQALGQAPARTRTAVPAATSAASSQAQSQTQAQNQNNGNTAASQNAQAMPTSVRVNSGESLWQIATRLLPADRSVNEFQIAASIYRNNPQAFNNGNAGSIRAGTLKIPPVSEIAREDPKVGSDLLSRGNIALPPLKNPAPAATPKTTDSGVIARSEQTPVFTATETANRQFQEERKAQREKLDSQLAAAEAVAADPEGASESDKALAQGKSPDKTEDNKVADTDKTDAAVSAKLDANTLKQMLDGSRDALDAKSKEIDKKLVQAIDRMTKSNESTLTAANSAVSGIAKQYDGTISSLQQTISDLKGQVSKLTRDNNKMRDMLLATDEKLQNLQVQMANGATAPGDASAYQRSLILIISGIGLLTLMLLILFVFFKVKSRQRGRTIETDLSDEDEDKEPSEEDKLLSDTISTSETEAIEGQNDQPQETAPDVPAGAEAAPADNASAQSEGGAGQNADKTDQSAGKPGEQPENNTAQEQTGADQDAAQKAWDDAAIEKAQEKDKDPDRDAMAQWAEALAQQNSEQTKSAEVGSSEGTTGDGKDSAKSDDGADAWAAAMAEQKAGESGNDTAEKQPDAQSAQSDDGADAWAAAMAEQKAGESGNDAVEKQTETPSSQSDDGADAWAAAMAEQKAVESGKDAAEKQKETPSSQSDDGADAWAAAMAEQKAGEEGKTKADEGINNPEVAPGADDGMNAWKEAMSARSPDTSTSGEEQAMAEAMSKSAPDPKAEAPEDNSSSGKSGAGQNATPEAEPQAGSDEDFFEKFAEQAAGKVSPAFSGGDVNPSSSESSENADQNIETDNAQDDAKDQDMADFEAFANQAVDGRDGAQAASDETDNSADEIAPEEKVSDTAPTDADDLIAGNSQETENSHNESTAVSDAEDKAREDFEAYASKAASGNSAEGRSEPETDGEIKESTQSAIPDDEPQNAVADNDQGADALSEKILNSVSEPVEGESVAEQSAAAETEQISSQSVENSDDSDQNHGINTADAHANNDSVADNTLPQDLGGSSADANDAPADAASEFARDFAAASAEVEDAGDETGQFSPDEITDSEPKTDELAKEDRSDISPAGDETEEARQADETAAPDVKESAPGGKIDTVVDDDLDLEQLLNQGQSADAQAESESNDSSSSALDKETDPADEASESVQSVNPDAQSGEFGEAPAENEDIADTQAADASISTTDENNPDDFEANTPEDSSSESAGDEQQSPDGDTEIADRTADGAQDSRSEADVSDKTQSVPSEEAGENLTPGDDVTTREEPESVTDTASGASEAAEGASYEKTADSDNTSSSEPEGAVLRNVDDDNGAVDSAGQAPEPLPENQTDTGKSEPQEAEDPGALKAFDWKVPDDEGFDVTNGHGADLPKEEQDAKSEDDKSILNMLGSDTEAPELSAKPEGSGMMSDSDIMRMVDPWDSEIPAEGSVEAESAVDKDSQSRSGGKADADKSAEESNDTWNGEMKSAPTQEEPVSEYDGLTPKEHQYLSDSLNLARLYFETGDTDEANKIISDIKKRGSADLKQQAEALLGEYSGS